MTGRHRSWLPDGTLVFEQYYLNNVAVDRHEYEAARLKDPCLPGYHDKKVQPVPANPELDLKAHQLFVESLLQEPNQAEARVWLASGKPTERRPQLGDSKTERRALEVVQRLYAAGAVSVTAVDLYSNDAGDAFCDRLVIALPEAKSERDAIRKICGALCLKDKGSLSPKRDLGETHLCLLL